MSGIWAVLMFYLQTLEALRAKIDASKSGPWYLIGTESESEMNLSQKKQGILKFKNSIVWQKAYKELKTVISAREHSSD